MLQEFESELQQKIELRHRLLLYVDEHLREYEPSPDWLRHILVSKADWDCIKKRALDACDAANGEFWARCLLSAFDIDNARHCIELPDVARKSPSVASAFAPLIQPVELDSRAAKDAREAYTCTQINQREPARKRASPSRALINSAIGKLKAGDVNGWYELHSIGSSNSFDPIVAFEAWTELDAVVRKKIAEAFEQYVSHLAPQSTDWFNTNQTPYVQFAMLDALAILADERPASLQNLDQSVWTNAIPALIDFQKVGSWSDVSESLLKLATDKDVDTMLDFLVKRSTHESLRPGRTHYLGSLFDVVWTDKLADALASVVEDPRQPANVCALILAQLYRKNHPRASGLLLGFLRDQARSCRSRFLQRAGAAMAIAYGSGEHWDEVLNVLTLSVKNARWILRRVYWWRIDDRFCKKGPWLPSLYLSDLFRISTRLAPFSEPLKEGFVGNSNAIADVRDAALHGMLVPAREESVGLMAAIAAEFPEAPHLYWRYRELVANVTDAAWQPLTPQELARLLQDDHIRLVRNADELLRTVLDALAALQEEIFRSTSGADPYWDNAQRTRSNPTPGGRPKEENAISDRIRDYLDSRLGRSGIVANREVQIRKGSETDIHISAIAQRPDGSFQTEIVVLETKGCWNPRLHVDMKEQLVERYLSQAKSSHGVYLVGFCQCDYWNNDNARKGKSRRNLTNGDMDSLRETLKTQARSYSRPGFEIEAFVLDLRRSK